MLLQPCSNIFIQASDHSPPSLIPSFSPFRLYEDSSADRWQLPPMSLECFEILWEFLPGVGQRFVWCWAPPDLEVSECFAKRRFLLWDLFYSFVDFLLGEAVDTNHTMSLWWGWIASVVRVDGSRFGCSSEEALRCLLMMEGESESSCNESLKVIHKDEQWHQVFIVIGYKLTVYCDAFLKMHSSPDSHQYSTKSSTCSFLLFQRSLLLKSSSDASVKRILEACKSITASSFIFRYALWYPLDTQLPSPVTIPNQPIIWSRTTYYPQSHLQLIREILNISA